MHSNRYEALFIGKVRSQGANRPGKLTSMIDIHLHLLENAKWLGSITASRCRWTPRINRHCEFKSRKPLCVYYLLFSCPVVWNFCTEHGEIILPYFVQNISTIWHLKWMIYVRFGFKMSFINVFLSQQPTENKTKQLSIDVLPFYLIWHQFRDLQLPIVYAHN